MGVIHQPTLSQLLLDSLDPADAAFAVQLSAAVQEHAHLPNWLAHCATFPLVERYSMLKQAARIFQTELPDYVTAQVLTRLAHDAGLFHTVLEVIQNAQGDE